MVAGIGRLLDRFRHQFLQPFFGYRGTTRGFEVSLMDILAFAVPPSARFYFHAEANRRWCWPAGLGLMLPLILFYAPPWVRWLSAEPQIFADCSKFQKLVRGIIDFHGCCDVMCAVNQ
jgi:hypothetical protein